MSLIKIRTNKMAVMYTGNYEITITDLCNNISKLCSRNSIVIISRNTRISCSSNIFYGEILRNAIFFEHKTIMDIKKILTLASFNKKENSLDFSYTSNYEKRIICVDASDKMGRCYNEIKNASNTYSKIINFLYLCKISDIELDIFYIVYQSAITTFCNKAIDIIESDLSKRWTLQSLSDIFNISEVAIRKKLESEGINFKELITETRMKKALSMMIEGKYNISQIAMCVGYKNTSYFISSFKNFFGVTPKQLQLSLI